MRQQRSDLPEVYRGRDRGRRWSRVSYGLYAGRERERRLERELRAWSLVLPPEAVFTHLTSARLRGWWLPEAKVHPVFAATDEAVFCPRRAGLVTSRHRRVPPAETIDGVRVATGAETLLAAARDLHLLDLVLMGDSALRLGQTTISELQQTARQRRRGAPLLRRVVPLLDTRSESPWESVLRVLHREAGIDVEPQREIFDDDGCFVARADLWITGTRRIHEYDGAEHRDGDRHRLDLGRDRRLLTAGWERVGLTAVDVLRDGRAIISSADQALGRRWDHRNLARWDALVAESLFGSIGQLRARTRWGCLPPAQTGS